MVTIHVVWCGTGYELNKILLQSFSRKHLPKAYNVSLQSTMSCHSMDTAVQGLRFSCYSWAPGHHSWTREPRHTVHVTDVYATESRTPPLLELSADRFSVGLLLHCSPPTLGQSRGMGKGVWRPCTAVLSCERGKTTHLLSIQITTNSSLL